LSSIKPLILSGGVGSRLWPLSRVTLPKQFLPLCSDYPLLVESAKRVESQPFSAPLVICNHEHRFLVAQALQQAGIAPDAILLEPAGRNTAAAIAIGALQVLKNDANALLLVMPSDHMVTDTAAFRKTVEQAVPTAIAGAIVTFGITPSRAETGYGYIRRGEGLALGDGVFRIARFIEKPPAAAAQTMLDAGDHYWNAGIFLSRAETLIQEMQQHAPAVLQAAQEALEKSVADLDFIRLDEVAFLKSPAISFDHAVMEKTTHGAVAAARFDWSDIGSWRSLWEVSEKTGEGNAIFGDALSENTANSLVYSADGILTATIGISDLIVIATDDSVLVASKDHSEDVKRIVDRLATEQRTEHLQAKVVYRPWGSYRTLESGEGYVVKRITVNPGASLSLQYHHHRAEHWVVVNGTARVTRGSETFTLERNQSTYIPIGEVHRLENIGTAVLHLVEVQSGSIITEDDIVRLDDRYGRQSDTPAPTTVAKMTKATENQCS